MRFLWIRLLVLAIVLASMAGCKAWKAFRYIDAIYCGDAACWVAF